MIVENTSALVTGGGSGLGKATAIRLANMGAKVAVLDVNADAAQAVADEIGGLAVAADITDEAAVKAALDQIEAAHGAARIVVNSAGIAGASRIVGRDGPHDLGFFEQIIKVNLIGTFNVLHLGDQITTLVENKLQIIPSNPCMFTSNRLGPCTLAIFHCIKDRSMLFLRYQ